MRLEQYLTEVLSFDDQQRVWSETVLPILKTNCKPYMKEKVMFFRGTSKKTDTIKLLKARTDRKPVDSPQSLHDGFDKGSQKIFRWKARSEGVFASSIKSKTTGYGHSHIVIPKGDFKYIWSPDIEDLFYKWKEDLRDDPAAKSPDMFPEFWEEFVRYYYQDYGLSKAMSKGNEVMFHCPNGYYIVSEDFEYAIKKEFNIK